MRPAILDHPSGNSEWSAHYEDETLVVGLVPWLDAVEIEHSLDLEGGVADLDRMGRVVRLTILDPTGDFTWSDVHRLLAQAAEQLSLSGQNGSAVRRLDGDYADLTFILHPYAEGGWRWAIHLAHPNELDLDPMVGCLNAGHGDTQQMAELMGDTVLVSIARALDGSAIRSRLYRASWDNDPITGTEHDRPILGVG